MFSAEWQARTDTPDPLPLSPDTLLREANRDEPGAIPRDPLVTLRLLIGRWSEAEIDAMIQHRREGEAGLRRISDVRVARDFLASIYAGEMAYEPDDRSLVDRIERRAAEWIRWMGASRETALATRMATMARLTATDALSRLAGELALDAPLPVLP